MQNMARIKQLSPYLIIIVWWVFMVWFFYPGYMSTDSYNQLMQGRGMFNYADHHPILMARIWGALDSIVEGPSLMLFLQLGLLSLGLLALIRQLIKNPVYQGIILALILFFPPVFSIVGIIWKDVWTLIGLVWGLAAFTKIITTKNIAISFYVVFGLVCLTFAALFRANAIGASFAVIVMMTAFFVWFWPKTLRLRIFAIFSLFLGFPSMFVFGLQASKIGIEVTKSNFDTITMGFDLAGMSVAAGERLIDKGYIEFISDDVEVSDIAARYSPRYHACLYRNCKGVPPVLTWTQNPSDLSHIRRNWVQTIASHPSAWLSHRLKVASQILNREGTGVWAPILWTPYSRSANNLGEVWDTKTRNDLRRFIIKHSNLTHSPFRYFITSIALATFLFFLVIFSKQHRRQRFAIFTILITGIAYQLTIFLAATSPDYRYSQPMIMLTLLAILLFITISFFEKSSDCCN